MITTCQGMDCHNLLPQNTGTRPRRWCSDRCRKTKYSVPCVDCGAPLNGSDGRGPNAAVRCNPCAARLSGEAAKIWTSAAIVLAMQEWAAEYGEPPAVKDWDQYGAEFCLSDPERAARWREGEGRWPCHHTVFREWGSWNAALVAAGFEARAPHGGAGNELRRRSMRAEAAA